MFSRISGALLLALAPVVALAQEATEAAEEGAEHAAEAGHAAVQIPFFSLYNTNFVVIIAFVVFIAVLLYLKVPGKVGEMLDKRADTIRKELDDARKLREEAQAILASYERKQKDVQEQVDRIIATAKDEAQAAADKAKADLKVSIERRIAGAEDQIAAAEAAAVKEVRDRAVQIATAVAGELLGKGMSADRGNALIDEAIATVEAKLH